VLVAVAKDEGAPEAARVGAAKALLDTPEANVRESPDGTDPVREYAFRLLSGDEALAAWHRAQLTVLEAKRNAAPAPKEPEDDWQ
jgi:hypothetical protein